MTNIHTATDHRHPLYGTRVPTRTVDAVRAWQRSVATGTRPADRSHVS